MDDHLTPVKKLARDLALASITLSAHEVRFLVDNYYAMQDQRIRQVAQCREMLKGNEPHSVLSFMGEQSEQLEHQIKRCLDKYSASRPIGQWMRSIVGIGPVIAAGMMANIDMNKAPTVGHIWRFAGLDPTVKWLPKTKRPWNASLKRLCFIVGESFVKFSGHADDVYGKVYLQRKDQEILGSASGKYKDQAAAKAAIVGKATKAYSHYSRGELSPGHIHARARRYAVKLFLSHLHHVWYVMEFGKEPPNPYPVAHLSHSHIIPPPNWPM